MIDLEINLRRLPRSAFWLVEIRSTEYPTVLEVPEARNLRLGRGSRVLVATAHSDGRPPDAEALASHAVAVTAESDESFVERLARLGRRSSPRRRRGTLGPG